MNRVATQTNCLKGVLFSGLGEEEAEALLGAATPRQYQAGAALFHQGDAPTYLFQLNTGRVKLSQVSSTGVQTTLRLMRPGELIGCVAVLQQFPFPATATATQDSTTLFWSAAQIAELTTRYPAIAANTLRTVGDRAKEMVHRVFETTHRNVDQRIARALLRLADQVGEQITDGILLETPGIRRDIAEMAGVTYFTVSRTLSTWGKQGLLKSGRERILVISPEVRIVAQKWAGSQSFLVSHLALNDLDAIRALSQSLDVVRCSRSAARGHAPLL